MSTTLIIDNYDSFTWNLVQLFGALGDRPIVRRNDAISMTDVRALRPARIVFSPGPGHPCDPARVGICAPILAELASSIPILGVCLGHQLIVSHYGGKIVPARAIVHGKASLIHHEGDGILHRLERPFEAMRYHSFVADPTTLPKALSLTAWCKDGTVMGVRHRRDPVFGVQFHPESIGTPSGSMLVEAFLASSQRRTHVSASECSAGEQA